MDSYGKEPFEMVRNTDPDTSLDAAELVDAGKWEARVLKETIESGMDGLTILDATLIFEAQGLKAGTGGVMQTCGPRFASLKEQQKIFNSGLIRGKRIVHLDQALREEWIRTAPEKTLKRMYAAREKELEKDRGKIIPVCCPQCAANLEVNAKDASVRIIGENGQIGLV